MKRLLLLPLLLLGLSFACDQPYEEVAGYKIGCPFNGTEDEMEIDDDNPGIFIQELKLEGGFFQTVKIDVLEGNIEGLTFSKYYDSREKVEEDLDLLISALEKKWGSIDEIVENEILAIKNPNSKMLSHVLITTDHVQGGWAVSVIYSSWNLNDYKRRVWEEKEAQKIKQLEKF